MTTLENFQAQAARIKAATETIAAYVQGTGMSAADQESALQAITEAADALVGALPTVPAPSSETAA